MKLYMIRHGESENNSGNLHSGWSHTSLTEKGVEDARKAGVLLKNIHFDKVYASDLPRTVLTCKTALPEYEFEPSELLREINVGILTDRSKDDCFAEYGEKYSLAKSSYDFTCFGGENSEMVRNRARKFLKLLEAYPYNNVAVFSHGAFIKHTLEAVLGAELDKFSFFLNNCGISVFEFNGSKWLMDKWNITSDI